MIIKPDEILADLERQLEAAEPEQRPAIQAQINARRSQVMQELGITNMGWGSQGYMVPGKGQVPDGTVVLSPTSTPGVFMADRISSASSESYGRVPSGTEGDVVDPFKASKLEFFDASGRKLTANEVAGTKVGADFAQAGWDVGFGAGVIPQGSSSASTTSSAVTTPVASTAVKTSATNSAATTANMTTAQRDAKSAYDLLYSQFQQYGLGALVEPLKNLITEGVSPAEFTIRLRETDAYKKRFAANQQRINKGLRALSEAEYIALEDQYQDVMRRYGLPESYYSRGDMGTQPGFEKFIGLDVSPVELEDRVQTAYNRVINANPEVSIALKNFYPGITNGDILAYALDPSEALDKIKRKITAAEIGGAAVQSGLTTNESDAEYLARYGITKEQAQAGYRTISGYLPRAQQLSSIYGKQTEGAYTQASAEREVFGTPGAAEEERKRLRLAALETSAFSGQSGLTGGALGRERAGQF